MKKYFFFFIKTFLNELTITHPLKFSIKKNSFILNSAQTYVEVFTCTLNHPYSLSLTSFVFSQLAACPLVAGRWWFHSLSSLELGNFYFQLSLLISTFFSTSSFALLLLWECMILVGQRPHHFFFFFFEGDLINFLIISESAFVSTRVNK